MYFKEINGNLKIEHSPVTKMSMPKYKSSPFKPQVSELDEAIRMQKDFINHNVRKEYA